MSTTLPASTIQPPPARFTRADFLLMKARGEKFAMLTAYDYLTASAAAAAGVHSLLIGDSMGTVLLGHPTTRSTPLALMLILGEAVRRGAPGVYLVGDLPYACIAPGPREILTGARRFVAECGCDAVKLEAEAEHADAIAELRAAGIDVIAHIGLRPQQVLSPDGYRAQARDHDAIRALVDLARRLVAAGATMLLLEAVPEEAGAAVLDEVSVPVIGCGAGSRCDGHVVVTEDLLGATGGKPPRFVPVGESFHARRAAAMTAYVEAIRAGRYPAPEHVYPLRRAAGSAS